MRKVIKKGTVITMNLNETKKYQKLDIVIDDDTITDLVENYNGDCDYLIDAKGKIVMPGLINCHTHFGMSIFRATNDNLNLNDWLNKKIFPVERILTEEDIHYTSLLSCLEMIKTGTTMVNEMYLNNDAFLKAAKKTKIRTLFGPDYKSETGNRLDLTSNFTKSYEEYKDDKLIRLAVAPHSLYLCNKEYLKECSDLALKLNVPIHIHFCETEDEVKTITNAYGKDPVDALEECGLLRNKLILAHGTFISDYGINKLKNYDVTIVHNPVSNLNLGCGIAPITKFKDYVNISLGTDGHGSGNNINMFYHMSLVDLLQKGIYKDSTITSSYEVLKYATINGAKALGVDDITGSIEIGKKADIIILDLDSVETYPTVDLINNVVHNVSPINVDTTIINGEVLMEKHKLKLDIDINEIKNKVQKIIDTKTNNEI